LVLLLFKTTENQDFEMAFKSDDNAELLQMWYQLKGCAQPPCYRLQPTAGCIVRFKVWNELHIFFQIRDNAWRKRA